MTGELQAAPEPAASLSQARRLRGHVHYVGDDLVAMHVIQQQPPQPSECLFEDMAVMVLQARHQRSLLLPGQESDSLRDLDNAIETVDMQCIRICIETGDLVGTASLWRLPMAFRSQFISTLGSLVTGTSQ
jgi:hypothetical protein